MKKKYSSLILTKAARGEIKASLPSTITSASQDPRFSNHALQLSAIEIKEAWKRTSQIVKKERQQMVK